MARVSSARVVILVAAVLVMQAVCFRGIRGLDNPAKSPDAPETEDDGGASYAGKADPTNNGDPNEDLLKGNKDVVQRHLFPFDEVMGDSITAFWGTMYVQTAPKSAYGIRIGVETDQKADGKGFKTLDRTPKALEFHFEVQNQRWLVKPQVSHVPDLAPLVTPAAIKPPVAEPHHRSEMLYFSASLSSSGAKKTGQTKFRMRIKSNQWIKSSERQLMVSPQQLQLHKFRIIVETDSQWNEQEGAIYFSQLYVGSTAREFGWCPTNLVARARKDQIDASVTRVQGSKATGGFFGRKRVYVSKCFLRSLTLYNPKYPSMRFFKYKKSSNDTDGGVDNETASIEAADEFADNVENDAEMEEAFFDDSEEEVAAATGGSSGASAAAAVVVVPVLAGAAYLYYRHRQKKKVAGAGASEEGQSAKKTVKGRVPHTQLAEVSVHSSPSRAYPPSSPSAAARPKSPAVPSTLNAGRPGSAAVRPKSPNPNPGTRY